MNRPVENGSEGRSLQTIGEAAHWRLAGLLLERPRDGWLAEIESISGELEDARLKSAAEASRTAEEGVYLHLFGPGGQVSPREVTYRPREDPGGVLADLAGMYRAFTFSPHTEDPIDHIGVETNFAGFLCLKEAYALADGNPEVARTVSRGLQIFLQSHLQLFAEALNERLGSSGPRYMTETVGCLLDLVERRLSLKPSE